jgi:hypothetical protein
VLLLEAQTDENYRGGDFTLPRDPRPLLGLEGPAWKRVLGELNMVQHLKRRISAQRPAFQVVLPGARFDVAEDDDLLRHELGRVLPGTRADPHLQRATETSRILDPLFAEDVTLPPDGFWARRELGRVEPRLPHALDELFPELPGAHPGRLISLAPASAATDAWPVGPVGAARLGDLWRHGPWRLAGGWDEVRRLLVERILLHSGELNAGLVVRRLEVRRGRVVTVVAGDAEERFGCGFVLFARPVQHLAALLPEDEKPPRALAKATLAISPGGLRHTLNVVMRDPGIPEGLAETAFLVGDPAAPLEGDNFVALYTHPRDGGVHVMSAQTIAPAEATAADLEALGKATLGRLRALMPFFDRHLIAFSSPPVPQVLWTPPNPAMLGICGITHDVGFKNVYLLGRQNVPGAGREGEIVSAWGAARTISLQEKKRDLLNREVLKG